FVRPRLSVQRPSRSFWRTKKRPDVGLAMQIAVPVYGYKSHVGADRRHRLIRTWSVTDAASYDGRALPALLDTSNTGSEVWADTAYRRRRNEKRIAAAGLVSKILCGWLLRGKGEFGDGSSSVQSCVRPVCATTADRRWP
ncbi:MAG: transposase, partial [Planctomycetota bacterium]